MRKRGDVVVLLLAVEPRSIQYRALLVLRKMAAERPAGMGTKRSAAILRENMSGRTTLTARTVCDYPALSPRGLQNDCALEETAACQRHLGHLWGGTHFSALPARYWLIMGEQTILEMTADKHHFHGQVSIANSGIRRIYNAEGERKQEEWMLHGRRRSSAKRS